MNEILAARYNAAQELTLDLNRRHKDLSKRASMNDEELAGVVERYASLTTRCDEARPDAALNADLNTIIQRRQRLIEEKIMLGDQYAALSEAESEARRLVSDLRQQVDKQLWDDGRE